MLTALSFLPTPASGIIHRKTLIAIRWLAIAGQLLALLTAHYMLGLPVPLLPPLFIIALSFMGNVALSLRLVKNELHRNRGATLSLAFDIVQLTLLLFFTGGLSNPFVILLLAPITVAATVLSGLYVIALSVLTTCCLTLLLASPANLWPAAHVFPPYFFSGAYAALLLSTFFLVLYVRRVARESRRLTDALNASLLALEREQKISAFGALAAAVTHELGSPLGTIAVVAKEMGHQLQEGALRDDVELLQQQVERCRAILADFAATNYVADHKGATLPLRQWIEKVARPYVKPGIVFQLNVQHREGAEPQWPMQPSLMHGIGNLIQNAFQFARASVQVELSWTQDRVNINILDDGPGFPAFLLPKLGSTLGSVRQETDEAVHMGLGLFIARTLLERSGAIVHFENRAYSDKQVVGACVGLEWQQQPI